MTHFMKNLGDLTGLDIAMAGFPPADAVSVGGVQGPVALRDLSRGVGAFGVQLGRWLAIGPGRAGRCRDGIVGASAPSGRSAA